MMKQILSFLRSNAVGLIFIALGLAEICCPPCGLA